MSGNVQWNGKFPIGPVRPEKWSSSKGGPHFPELFQLGRTVPLSFEPNFPEILVEWIAPSAQLPREESGHHKQDTGVTGVIGVI